MPFNHNCHKNFILNTVKDQLPINVGKNEKKKNRVLLPYIILLLEKTK